MISILADPPSFRRILSIHYKYVAIVVFDIEEGTTSTTPQEQTHRSLQSIWLWFGARLSVLLDRSARAIEVLDSKG